MKLFKCQNCDNALHFNNTICLNCQHRVGYIEHRFEMAAVDREGSAWRAVGSEDGVYKFCANWELAACNWLIEADGEATLCESCRHNRTIPDLSTLENRERWHKIELAKRYLFRSLMRWNLPMPDRTEDPEHGLAFDLLSDVQKTDGTTELVKTGHDEGVITLNVAEADDAERETRRQSMGETYRTLVGHFRHEIGHYYWDVLVRDRGKIPACREVFGDESVDYGEALKRHYESGPGPDWRDGYISAYATAHPWEDFAETWAHYIHLVDALETARSYGINVVASFDSRSQPVRPDFEPYSAKSIEELVRAWVPLTVAINGVNRSMGQPDLYPFVLSRPVMAKLGFIHDLIHARN